ncbi:MAG: SMC-Scp complex subunit ScpB [Elusimicrobia bacterium]|jgi:segregation and condensation protein B|nr:SMC-Scp complex subunit ScpB [Elusimicrobiota bacterium]
MTIDKEKLKNIVECLLYVSSKPIKSKNIASVIEDVTETDIKKTIIALAKEYDIQNRPVFIQKVAGGWRMATRKEYGRWVKKFYSTETTYNLSTAALETLSIVAYRQPITTTEVEDIRGVSSGGVLRGLFEKRLIKIAGRKESIGRPIIYRTTDKFLEYFGLESISDLPPLEELGIDDNIEELIDGEYKKEN